MRRASVSPSEASRVQSDAPSPYGESLATRIASSASFTFSTAATGPNVSSLKTGISSVTSARIVGS